MTRLPSPRGPRHSSVATRHTIAPITRAVRQALVASALALSFGVPTVGATSVAMPSPEASILGSAPSRLTSLPQPPVVDPTIVVDGPMPSSVTEGSGADGTAAIAWQREDIVAQADFEPIDDPALIDDRTWLPSAVAIVHDGVTDVVAPDAIGLEAFDASILNTGSIRATGILSAIGVAVSGDTGEIVNDGTIIAEVTGGDAYGYAPAIGVRVFAGSVQVENGVDGVIDVSATSTGRARARGVYAVAMGGTDVTVTNAGDITADAIATGGRAEAHGVYAFGYGTATTVHNSGDIASHASADGGSAYATGINAIGYGSGDNTSHVTNEGTVLAQAEGAYAYSFGVFNLTRQRDGSAVVDNSGDITASATGNYATSNGILNLALRYGTATTTNSGDVQSIANAAAGGSATGIYTKAYVQDALVDNSGNVLALATGDRALAVGIYASSSLYGTTTLTNSGDVQALATGGDGWARAAGLAATSETTVDIVNDGTIEVDAYTGTGPATAVGAYAFGQQSSTVHNYGSIDARAQSGDGDAVAYGAFALSGFASSALIVNGGDLDATAIAGGTGNAAAYGAAVSADVASVFNDGHAGATAIATDGDAFAAGIYAYGSYSRVSNYGDVLAQAQSVTGTAQASGLQTIGYQGAVSTNSGDVLAHAVSTAGLARANGIYNFALVADAITDNSGTITAIATGDSASVNGVANVSRYYGDAITINSGDIVAIAEGGIAPEGETEAVAFGVYNFALVYDSIVENTGSILAQAIATADMTGQQGFLQAKALGAAAINHYGYWDAGIVNHGDITAVAETSRGYAQAWGVAVQTGGAYGGNAFVENTGTITARSHADIGLALSIGAYVTSLFGDASLANSGDINAFARAERGILDEVVDYAYVTGVNVAAAYGAATIANAGRITVRGEVAGGIVAARGIEVFGETTSVTNAQGAEIIVTGESDLFGGTYATGIEASAIYGVDVVNNGSILVHTSTRGLYEGQYSTFIAVAGSVGIYAGAGFQGDASITNTSDITVVAESTNGITYFNAGAAATGLHAYAKYDAAIVNSGDIFASATSELGVTIAYGALAKGKYSAQLDNAGSIIALATVGSLATDYDAGRAFARGTHTFGSDHATTTNTGTIIAHATVTPDGGPNPGRSIAMAYGVDVGANSPSLDGTIVNHGDIEAAARADYGYATAYGTFVGARYDADTTNTGSILAIARADHGDAFAVGSHNFALHTTYYVPCTPDGCDYSNPVYTPVDGLASLDNAGDITAVATAADGIARSYGGTVFGAFGASLTNSGDITAVVTDAAQAYATGAIVDSDYAAATLDNQGNILAAATGMEATVIGVRAHGATATDVDNRGRIEAVANGDLVSASALWVDGGDVGAHIANTGTILAAAYGADATATAVYFGGTGDNVLVSTGTIAALGDGERLAVATSATAQADLTSYGTLIGAVRTGDRDDSLHNTATGLWHAVGSSDFGAGSDGVTNDGVLFLDHASIRLGAAGENDAFANHGTLAVDGDGAIDLGGTFTNTGRVSFVDGVTGDTLAIGADLAGQGTLAFDVHGPGATGDWLTIAGDVDADAVQTLDVNFIGLALAPQFLVPLVNVGGDSTTGNFVLGNVGYDAAGFVTLDFSLQADIDASNASDDVFALAVSVSGLNNAGSLAAAVAPGVQSLVQSQVGSWRQRSAGMTPAAKTLSPWLRTFADGGGMDLAHAGNIGSGGDFAFHQSDRGWELGLEARLSGHLGVGVLFGGAEGNQRLRDDGGRDHFTGRTFGLFGTWQGADGAYVDVSQRWTGVDAHLETAGGELHTEVAASTLNVEAGLAGWNFGGLHMAPELQYTRSRIGDIDPMQVGGSTFTADGGTASRARLGLVFDRTFTAGSFTLRPYGALNVVREFDGEYAHAVNGALLGTTDAGGTSAQVDLGLGARRGALTFSGSVQWIDGGALEDEVGAQFTTRYSW